MVTFVYAHPLTYVWISCLLFECMSYGCINALKSHGISAFWSCDRILIKVNDARSLELQNSKIARIHKSF